MQRELGVVYRQPDTNALYKHCMTQLTMQCAFSSISTSSSIIHSGSTFKIKSTQSLYGSDRPDILWNVPLTEDWTRKTGGRCESHDTLLYAKANRQALARKGGQGGVHRHCRYFSPIWMKLECNIYWLRRYRSVPNCLNSCQDNQNPAG